MTDDDRLRRHLLASADAITLTPADPGAAVRRGTRRRDRRRAALGGVAAVAVAATTFSVLDRQPTAQVDSDLAAGVVASPLDWTVVAPTTGLGYSRSATVADGAVYSLSTAPGPYDERSSFEPHLYRSDDGAEWVEVALPEGVKASSIAAQGGALYAIGTAPAGGGGRDLVVATSTDDAATWSSITLPGDLAEMEARHPGQISISQPVVAAQDATHLVASVVVTATPDVEALLPDADPSAGWETTRDGVTLYEMVPCEDPTSDRCSAPSETTTAVAPEGDPAAPATDEPVLTEPKVAATYTWEELGLDPELRALIGGRTLVYASDDGTTFEPATLPDGTGGWGGHLLAAEDGYRLYLGQADDTGGQTAVLHSEDGRTWTEAARLPGSPQSAGLLGGQPAVGLHGIEGGLVVQVEQGDGSYLALDVLSAVEGADGSSGVGDVAFGPLGLAALVWTDEPGSAHIVHSLDGRTLSSVAVADHLEEAGAPMGISVTADAILVRVDEPTDGDLTTPPTQRVLVGTPR